MDNSLNQNNKDKEKRQYQRHIKSLSIRLSVPDYPNATSIMLKGIEATALDVSKGGMYTHLNIPEKEFLNQLMSHSHLITLEIRLAENDKIIKLQAQPIWKKDFNDSIEHSFGCGFRFIESKKTKQSLNVLETYMRRDPLVLDEMRRFELLIDGERIDTGLYEYFPYSDKTITDFKTTYKIIHQLKKGNKLDNYKDYIYAQYCVATDNVNKMAIEAAYRASQTYKKFSIDRRRKIMGDIHDLLVENRSELIKLFIIEGHSVKLSEWEFLGMERCLNKDSLDFYQQEMWKEIKNGDESIYIVRKPDGVVCVSPPKNAACSNSLLTSLVFLAGNTVVIKPPLKMPLSTIYLWENIINKALMKNGAPKGCVNIILGNSKKIMEEWLESPLVNDIVYFGDSDMGLEIGRQAYFHNKKAILELSGNDILFVWKDADIEKAIASLLDSFLGSTQICMVPKNAVIHEEIYEQFISRFTNEVKKLKVGLPSSPDTYFTPIIKSKEFFDFLNDAISKGAQMVCGGKKINHMGQADENGLYIEPTLLLIENFEKAKTMKVVNEENFFPLLPLIKVSGSDDDIFNKMLELSEKNQYGLRTSVWVKSEHYLNKFINEIQNSGLLKINSRHVAFSIYASTHGGTKKTGGPYGEMNYIWQKTSHLQGITVRKE